MDVLSTYESPIEDCGVWAVYFIPPAFVDPFYEMLFIVSGQSR